MSDEKKTINNKTKIDLSRRRLAKVGLLTVPALAVLPGKPAMALYEKNNCTVSGNLSGNMSDNANDSYCEDKKINIGHPPSYWATLTHWPVVFPALPLRTDTFYSVFNAGTSDTLNDVLLSVFPNDLDAQAVAAYLSSLTVTGYGMTPAEVISSYATYGAGTAHEQERLLYTYQYLNGTRT